MTATATATTGSIATTGRPAERGAHAAQPSRAKQVWQNLAGVAGDIGLPLAGYYGLHALGFSDVTALAGGTVAATIRITVVALRTRQVTWFSILMFAVYALGLGLAFVGDAHLMLVKDSFTTGLVGLAFLGSLVVGKPLVLSSMQTVRTGHTAMVARLYPTSPTVRRTVRGMTALWGVGLLVDAVVRVPIVLALPVDVGVAVSHGLTFGIMGVLALITVVVSRVSRRAYAREVAASA